MDQPVSISQAQVAESNFFSRVYMWMAAGLFISAFGSLFVASNPAFVRALVLNPMLMLMLVIGEFGLVIWLSAALYRLSVSTATALFCVFSLLNGITLAPILLIYTGASIVSTFAITAGCFIFFSVYGYATKVDLTRVGQLAYMGLFGIIIASVVNIFMRSSGLELLITYLGIPIFLGLIAYKSQMLKEIYQKGFESQDMERKVAIYGALTLYLSFINLFLLLLRLFGQRR